MHIYFTVSRIRSPRDMFSFLMSDLRPPKPEIDQSALEAVIAVAESAGSIKCVHRYNAFSVNSNQLLSLYCCRMQSASDLPMAMRYRNLQKTYKQHVGVYQSSIHGLGLYCVKEIEPGEMVIEYAGTVIRSVLTDKREKLYDSKVSEKVGRVSQVAIAPLLCHTFRVLGATCSVLTLTMSWMQPCQGMKQGSSTMHVR